MAHQSTDAAAASAASGNTAPANAPPAYAAPANTAHFVLAQADAAFAAGPYPTYRHLRDTAPLCRQPDGSVFLSRYDDVRAVISDAERFSSDKRADFLPKFEVNRA